MSNLAARLHAALWWLLPLAALAVAIGWETDWGSALDKRLQPPEAIAPKAVVASLLPEYAIAGGVAASSEMVQRTLFNPTRRPAPVAAPDGGSAQLKRGQFALTGTMMVDGKSTAFLREVAGNNPRRVGAGETINGLLVAEVKPDRVRLTLGDESEELVLKVATNPRPTAPPAAVAQAATPPASVARTAAAPPAPPVASDAAQTLAERRRAARTAAASTPAPVTPAGGVDPGREMDQRYRERAAVPNFGPTQ